MRSRATQWNTCRSSSRRVRVHAGSMNGSREERARPIVPIILHSLSILSLLLKKILLHDGLGAIVLHPRYLHVTYVRRRGTHHSNISTYSSLFVFPSSWIESRKLRNTINGREREPARPALGGQSLYPCSAYLRGMDNALPSFSSYAETSSLEHVKKRTLLEWSRELRKYPGRFRQISWRIGKELVRGTRASRPAMGCCMHCRAAYQRWSVSSTKVWVGRSRLQLSGWRELFWGCGTYWLERR